MNNTHVGTFGLLFLIFTTLKLTGSITWSWWWVTAPLWMPISILLGVGLILFLWYFVVELMTNDE